MSKTSTSETPGSIDPDQAPPVTQTDIDRAVFRVGRNPVQRKKVRVDMLLDASVLEYFKGKTEDRWQTEDLINEALGAYIRAHP